jgi:hypothetical protein
VPVVFRIECVEAQQDVGGLPEHEAHLGPVERDLLEPEERHPLLELALQPGGIDLEPWERHSGLDASLQREQLDLKVDGVSKFRLAGLDDPQLGNFPGFTARCASRRRRLSRHGEIVHD